MIRPPMPSIAPHRFLFAVPNHQRDLEGHALVAYHLARRYGHEATFTHVPMLEDAVLAVAPDVVVLDRVDTRASVSRLAKSLGMKVALLPTVGFTQDTTEIEARRAGKDLAAERLVDCCLVWGDYARRMLLESRALPESTVHTVGCPRFDAYSEPYRSLAEPRESLAPGLETADADAPLIVWATNTCHVRTRDLETTVASARASGVPEAEIRGQLADERTAFNDLAGAVTALAARHPDWRFLIKLHPAETPAPYAAIAARAPNIALASNARIRDVLHHCTALLANTSTTATEAWMLGKPVYEIIFGTYQVPAPAAYLAGNHIVRSIDELDASLVKTIASPETAVSEQQRAARTTFLEDVYFRIDGRSAERCAAQLHALVAAEQRPEDRAVMRASAAVLCAERRNTVQRRPGARIKAALGISNRMTLRFWRRAFWRQFTNDRWRSPWVEPITIEMVQAHFDRFDRVHPRTATTGGAAMPPSALFTRHVVRAPRR
ncbi:MAG TPA: surface carbohydrate biosynthesis protein [Gemmatimonadaceae bacterium]